MPNIGEQEENPVHMSAPPGYGGQGVVSLPASIAPAPITPSGNAKPLSVLPPVSPPAYYRSSPNSLVGQEVSSIYDKIVGAMMNAGTRPGDLPVTTKLKLANAEAKYKESQDQLAWANYHKSLDVFDNLLQQQRKDNITTAYGLMPGMISQIRAASTPEAREALVRAHASAMDAIAPGTGTIITEYGKNPFHVGMWQAAAADFNNPAAKQLRELIDTNGLENVLQMPEGKALMTIMGHDGATSVVGGFAQPDSEKLATGKMNEEEFRKLYKARMYDPKGLAWSPQLATAMESYLDTVEGEQFMVGKGVNTNQMQIKKHSKDKAENYIQLQKDERFKQNEELIAFETSHPGSIDPAKFKAAKEQNAIALGDLQKQTNPGENANNSVVQRWHIKTNHRWSTMDEALASTDPADRQFAMDAFDEARKEQDAYVSQNAMNTKLASPGDTSNYIDRDELLKTGRAVGVKGDVSQRDLLTNKKYLKSTPEQKKALSELNISQSSAHDIFDLADKALRGSGYGAAAADAVLQKPDGLLNNELKAVAKANFPELAVYVSRREATLGKFARSISGEVGVLTDQDVVRVRNLFPVGGDTSQIRAAKRKALDALITLNRKFAVDALAGEMLPEDILALKNSDKYKSAVNGIFGSVEGLKPSEAPQSQTPMTDEQKAAGAELKERKDTRSRAERLAEEMRKKAQGQ